MTALNDFNENEQFDKLLQLTVAKLDARYFNNEFSDSEVDGNKFEQVVFDTIKIVQHQNKSEIFSNWCPKLVSGRRFPDIVLEIDENIKFGIEVKTSKGSDWKTLGGSIMESTRIDGVEKIVILFAKLNPFQIRFKSFEDSIVDVAVTHSPRYLIDLDVLPEDTIFKKIETEYPTIWQSEKPFEYFRSYFKDKAIRENTDLWWIGDEESKNTDDLPRVQIQFFSKLSRQRKEYLISKSMILYPNIFSEVADYAEIAIWFMNMGIINNSLRDIYSAGSNEIVLDHVVASKFKRLYERILDIQNLFKNIESDTDLINKFSTKDSLNAYVIWMNQIKNASSQSHQEFLKKLFTLKKFT